MLIAFLGTAWSQWFSGQATSLFISYKQNRLNSLELSASWVLCDVLQGLFIFIYMFKFESISVVGHAYCGFKSEYRYRCGYLEREANSFDSKLKKQLQFDPKHTESILLHSDRMERLPIERVTTGMSANKKWWFIQPD